MHSLRYMNPYTVAQALSTVRIRRIELALHRWVKVNHLHCTALAYDILTGSYFKLLKYNLFMVAEQSRCKS